MKKQEAKAYDEYYTEVRQMLSKHLNQWPNALIPDIVELINVKKQTLQELLDEVEGRKKDETLCRHYEPPIQEFCEHCPYEARLHNQALDTITTIIKRKMEKL